MALECRLCERGDEERLSLFHREARGRASSPEFWRWKYFDNPAGDSCVAVALEGERVVGRLGFIPIAFRISGKVIVAAQQVDSDILPDYRRGGTFFLLARVAERMGRERRLGFGFGFATDETLNLSTEALGFSLVASVGRRVKVLDYSHYLRSVLGTRGSKIAGWAIKRLEAWRPHRRSNGDVRVFEVERFDGRFDRLWEIAAERRIAVVKDSTYLNWRYMSCPSIRYAVHVAEHGGKLGGFIVLHTRNENGVVRGIIDDIVCDPEVPQVRESLLAAGISDLEERGSVSAVCWTARYHPIDELLGRLGFRRRPARNYLIVAPSEGERVNLGFLKDERNWQYMLGDSDYHLSPGEGSEVPHTDLSLH